MLRNAPPRKSGPLPAGHRATSQNTSHNYRSAHRFRKQPAPPEMKKRPLRRFDCSFCGNSRPESDLIGRDGALLFCGRCVTALDALRDGADDALAIWREPS